MRTRHGVALAGLLTAALGATMATAAAAAPWAGTDRARTAPAGTPRAGTPGWTQDGYGPGNGGWNPSASWLVPPRLGRLAKRWTIAATGTEVCARQAAPVVADGRLFLAGRESLGAYDAVTGQLLWSYPYADPMDTRTPMLAVSGSTLLVGTWGCQSASDADGELLAINARTGGLRWKAHTDAPDTTLTVDRGVAVVGGEDAGSLGSAAFRISTGRQLWQRALATPATGVSAGGTLLLTDHDDDFHATGALGVDIVTGQVRWKSGRPLSVRAADVPGTSFLATDEAGALLKLDAESGRIAWSAPGMAGPLAVDPLHVYVATVRELVSLDVASGRMAWHRAGYPAQLRPVVAGGVLYTVTAKKRLDTLNAVSGRKLRFAGGDKPVDHPVIAGDWLYLTDGSNLAAYTVPRPGHH